MKCLIVLFVALFAHCELAQAYTAAVIEYYSQSSDTPINTILKNLEEYKEYLDRAHANKADIVVFPEYGLTTLVKDPTEHSTEINDQDHVIKELAAAAYERQLYLVVNLLEKEVNTNKKTKYYNTNLVFDRNGTIIKKYRKINLYQEPKLTAGDPNQDPVFTTDFGVTFGMFTCFDIMFYNPSRRVLENRSVTDIVYPAAWVSTMPFFTSLTVQHGYALANGVTLLAANYGHPKTGSGGSGIYLADGKVAEIYIADSSSTKPIIQKVTTRGDRVNKTICPQFIPFGLPGDLTKSNVSNYNTTKNFPLSDATFKSVDMTQESVSTSVCDGSLCCNFDLTIDTSQVSTSKYKMMAYDGPISADQTTAQIQVCSLVACENDSNDSCGSKLESVNGRFTKITVNGNMKKDENTFFMPLTLNTFLQPITQTVYCDNPNATDSDFVQLTTVKDQQDVLVFGLLAREASAALSVYGVGVLAFAILSVFWFCQSV